MLFWPMDYFSPRKLFSLCFLVLVIVMSVEKGTLASPTCDVKHPVDGRSWRLCASNPPEDDKLWPSVGNGHIATVVHSDTVYMNGLYNGNGSTSTRARIPAHISVDLNLTTGNTYHKTYCLYMDNGMFVETYEDNHWSVEMKVYAHRTLSRVLVTQITVTTDGNQSKFQIPLATNAGGASKGIQFSSIEDSELENVSYVSGQTKEAETPETGVTPVHVYFSKIPSELNVKPGVRDKITYTYLMSVSPFQKEAKSYFEKAQRVSSNDTLEYSHVTGWQALWDSGRVDIYDNLFLARLTYSCLYYIYSALPTVEDQTWPFYGLSPADLAHNGYNGHMFWDQDTWMFPPLLMLNPDVSSSIVSARIRALKFAEENAIRTGYKGARYPWESAMSGLEVTPAGYDSGPNEQHISGDVALAFRQYLMMTNDCDMLKTGNMKSAIFEIAEFWKSRVSHDKSRDVYEIFGVMPPDEYQAKINNSVYTNYIAQQALRLPAYVCKLSGCVAPVEYENIANKMYIPFDSVRQFHPEFDGYNTSTIVKQADVILLGWPLDMEMSPTLRRKDLEIYEKVTPGGPAMSWGMFTVGWLEIGECDKANETFYRQQLNRRDPFNIWTENADGNLGVTNFITGMGGYLQSLIFGYAGVRIRDNQLLVNCAELPNTSGFRLKEVDYLGSVLDITCDKTTTEVSLVRGNELRIDLGTRVVALETNKTLCVARQPLAIIGTVSKCKSSGSGTNDATTSFHRTVSMILILSVMLKLC